MGTLLAMRAKVWYKSPASDIHSLVICAENINVGKIKGENFAAQKHLDTGTKLFPGSFSYKLEERDSGVVEFTPIEIFINTDLENSEGT